MSVPDRSALANTNACTELQASPVKSIASSLYPARSIHSSIIILYPSEWAVTYLSEGFPPKARMWLVSPIQKYYINKSDDSENIVV
jgi:hypothetical protein